MAENLSRNPTCKNNTTDYVGPSWTRLTGQSVGDTGRTTCGRATVGAASFPNIGSAGTMAASAGTTGGNTYSYVAWVRSSVARDVQNFLSRYNGSSYVGTASSIVTTSLAANTWTKVRGTGTVPAGGTYDRMGVHTDMPTGAAGTYDVGAVRIVQGNVPDLEFADGDTAGWVWDGTAGNSTSQESVGSPPVDLLVYSARAATRATRPLLSGPVSPLPVPIMTGPSVRSTWSFVIGPRMGGYDWEMTNAKARKATFRRAAPSTASFTIDGRDPLAEKVVDLGSDLHLIRDRGDGLREPLYRGRVGVTTDDLGVGHKVAVPSADYREVLQRRNLTTTSQVTWTAQDQYTIAFGLITQAQNKPGGDYGIVNAAGTSGVTRDRTYELGDNIGQRLQELSEVENGFDFDILPNGPSGLDFTAWRPQRGVDRGVILEYGGLVRSVTRGGDAEQFANAIRVTGQPPEGSSTPPAPHEGYSADIETDPRGRWDKVVGTSIVLSATLAERRTWLVDYHRVLRPSWTVRLKRGAWEGPDHIWLGDPVKLRINSGRLKVDESIRVEEIDVVIDDDDGGEDITLVLGAPRPDFARRVNAMQKRIVELEKRR